jgi:aryl-alcohol dehydrogenase-like predicted oxidoreductase
LIVISGAIDAPTWVLAKGDDIIPIPGTKSPRRLEENAAAVDVMLSAAEGHELDNAISREATSGVATRSS